MTLEEAIKHCEEVAEKYCEKVEEGLTADDFCDSCASEHRQLDEWLKELKERRKIDDVLLQFLVDTDLDICCDDLMDNDDKICEERCINHTKECWFRWAKLKAREVNDE